MNALLEPILNAERPESKFLSVACILCFVALDSAAPRAVAQGTTAASGTVVAWGAYYGNYDYFYGQPLVPADLSGVIAIAAGAEHSVALKSDGTVVAWWGFNRAGETTVPVGLSGVTAIAAGRKHTLALKGDGTVVAWGHNSSGQTNVPAGLSGVTAIAAGDAHSLALKSDGTVVAWGCKGVGS